MATKKKVAKKPVKAKTKIKAKVKAKTPAKAKATVPVKRMTVIRFGKLGSDPVSIKVPAGQTVGKFASARKLSFDTVRVGGKQVSRDHVLKRGELVTSIRQVTGGAEDAPKPKSDAMFPKMDVEGDDLVIRVNLKGKAVPSSSGKMSLICGTGGWREVPGAGGLRINLMAGYKTKT